MSLSNIDLEPTKIQNWNRWNYATIWMGMLHNLPVYIIAGSLLTLGLSPWAAITAILIGSVSLWIGVTLSGRVGQRYGIPFPVWARSTFGLLGANGPALVRAFVAIMWFGIQTYTGGIAVDAIAIALIPGWGHALTHIVFLGLSLHGWLDFMVFWFFNVLIVTHGMEAVKRFELWAGPLVMVVMGLLVVWAIHAAHGLGPLFSQPSSIHGAAFWLTFAGAVTVIIGALATLVLNIPDFTRFSASRKEFTLGQLIGLPPTYVLFAFAAIIITSASKVAFGHIIFDPVDILIRLHNPVLMIIGGVTLSIAAISVNVSANVVSPAYDLANLIPRWITFRRGGLIASLLAIASAPWLLMRSSASVFAFLGNVGGVLGPVFGILIADYYIRRRGRLQVDALYDRALGHPSFSWIAYVSWIIGSIAALVGQSVSALHWLYALSWYTGVIVGFTVQWLLSRMLGPSTDESSVVETVDLSS